MASFPYMQGIYAIYICIIKDNDFSRNSYGFDKSKKIKNFGSDIIEIAF